MQLSKRLQMVADCVSQDSHVADVGCDHAYISISLIKNQRALASIAMDINEGPLAKAKENIAAYGYEGQISTRLSNGLEKLCPGEADSIVIAGMGGPLMVQILSEGHSCVKEAKELILQPQSDVEKVREYLHNIKFIVCQENMCIDDGKFYVVIHSKNSNLFGEAALLDQLPKSSGGKPYIQRTFDKYGQLLLESKHPVLKDYLWKEYHKTKLIRSNLLAHPSEKNQARYEQVQEEMNMLEYALSYYD